MTRAGAVLLLSSLIACGSDPKPPGDPDAGLDAAVVVDAAVDAAPVDSEGCRTGAGLTEGEHTFDLEGYPRRYVVRLPTGYTRDRAWPVVLALHGNGGSVAYWDGTTGDRDIRSVLAADAILVILEAIEGNWRDYNQPAATWPARVELELRYVDEVVRQVRAALCVRDDGLFAMGFSGGGSFAGALACRRADVRAIAVGGAVEYVPEADCTRPVPAWITNGAQDQAAARDAYRDLFRTLGGCAATSTPTAPAPCAAYDGCAAATPVHYCEHPGGHVWPPFASAAMWAFFQAQLPAR
ncbi:MAG: alpha/beta hydrolase-fold protein [Kofleriaceae bacterium]